MKLKSLTFLFVLFAFLASCSSDDGDSSNNNTEGTWLLTNFQLNQSYDIDNNGTPNSNMLNEVSCNVQNRFVFDSDGTGALVSDGEQISVDAEEINGSYEYAVECDNIDSSIGYAWSEEGTSVYLTQTFLGDTELIKSGNTLTYFLPNAFEIPIIENGNFTGYEFVDVTFIYTKQ